MPDDVDVYEDWECLGCRQTVTDGVHDLCRICLMKSAYHDLDMALSYWREYQEKKGEMDNRNAVAAKAIKQMEQDLERIRQA